MAIELGLSWQLKQSYKGEHYLSCTVLLLVWPIHAFSKWSCIQLEF